MKASTSLGEVQKQKQNQNNQIKDWLKKLREVVYDGEDLLDDFSTQVLWKQLMLGKRISREVRLFFSRSNQFVNDLRMGHNIKALRERLDDIEADGIKFKFAAHVDERAFREQITSSEYDVIIGRQDDKVAVKIFLMNSNYKDNVSVMSIVGIGGLGKTALAQHIYNDEQFKEHFGVKICLSVSGCLGVRKILKEVIGRDSNDQLESLKNELAKKIKKKYLLVLDDVWDGEDGDDGEKWDSLKGSLPRDVVGSKIVAFCQDQELGHVDEKIRKEIVKRCCGVPLVIKAIARLMSLKDRAQWLPFIVNDLPDRIRDDNIIQPLKLSYDALPSFIKHRGGSLEIDGLGIFENLLWRSFFHDVKKDGIGNIKSCKMHDFMHDLATRVSGLESTIEEHEGQTTSSGVTRHVSCDMKLDLCLRALVLSHLGIKEMTPLIEKLKHLKYLDLSNNWMRVLPNFVTNLVNLQVLKLNGCGHLMELPRGINKLINLRHLDDDSCENLEYMPHGIGKLSSLQTLSCFVVAKKKSPKSEMIGGLDELKFEGAKLEDKKYLQTMTIKWDIDMNSDIDCMIKCCKASSMRFPRWLLDISNLVRIHLVSCIRLEHILPLDGIPSLEELLISSMGNLELKGLWKKSRGEMKDDDDELTVEEELIMLYFPCLSSLTIYNCPNLISKPLFPTLHEGLQNLSSLQKLFINECPRLKSLPLHDQGMSSLHTLVMSGCRELKSLSKSKSQRMIPHLPSLKELRIIGLSEELNR
ncbi:hypothetical protein SADUNF_Sadunf16G0204000 [Salix dunnii]|uniref:Uncharacterized protein n=1 Tax=Salix dunnii TaxID=1413687 RepID=A0A835J9V0_9ROSI|nr:hypothetical protein SADUNF_Sadunf16G0204000 [Salix dunnii]